MTTSNSKQDKASLEKEIYVQNVFLPSCDISDGLYYKEKDSSLLWAIIFDYHYKEGFMYYDQ